MSESTPQNFGNHSRRDPIFVFFLVPALLVLFIWTAVIHFHHRDVESLILAAIVFVLLGAVLKMRAYSLKVQDRVIRLEERLRLSQLAAEPLRGRISELTIGQFIALRFASDAEVAALANRALTENLNPKQIKQAIQNWRPDNWRV